MKRNLLLYRNFPVNSEPHQTSAALEISLKTVLLMHSLIKLIHFSFSEKNMFTKSKPRYSTVEDKRYKGSVLRKRRSSGRIWRWRCCSLSVGKCMAANGRVNWIWSKRIFSLLIKVIVGFLLIFVILYDVGHLF